MRKRTLIILSLLIALVVGCGERKSERPRDVLSPEQLTSLLIDVYVAEAVADNLPLLKDSAIKYFYPFEQKLLASKNIPDSILRSTYRYYIAHPKDLEKVYDVLIDSLTVREQSTVILSK
jgi:hypothetical protein